jgi:hypothetical protein
MRKRQAKKILKRVLALPRRWRFRASLRPEVARATRRLHRDELRRGRAWVDWSDLGAALDSVAFYAWVASRRTKRPAPEGAWGSSHPWPRDLRTLDKVRARLWPPKKGGGR